MKRSALKILVTFLFLLFTYLFANAQNLVPNPSFEDTVSCTGPWNCSCTLEIAYPWFNPNTATSDFISIYFNCGDHYYNQNPRTGSAYAGIFGWLVQTREYLEVKLDSSLQQGIKYCLSFYISRNEGCSGATDKIGAYFSNDSLLSNSPYNIPVQPQIETTAGVLISDTMNWIQISGEFIAQGGESFLTIGNFRDTANCLWQILDSNNFVCSHAYYYIDDVSLYRCDSVNSIDEINFPNIFDIYYTDDYIQIKMNTNIPQAIFQITDVQGKEVRSANVSKDDNIYEISKNSMSKGLYLFNLKSANHKYTRKFVVF